MWASETRRDSDLKVGGVSPNRNTMIHKYCIVLPYPAVIHFSICWYWCLKTFGYIIFNQRGINQNPSTCDVGMISVPAAIKNPVSPTGSQDIKSQLPPPRAGSSPGA